MAFISFNAAEVPTESPREALPAGDYPVIVSDSTIKTAKSGGTYLELTLQVIDGPYHNRLVWDRITLDNLNATATEIGKRQLSQACHAVGVLQLQDSAQLHGLPMVARLAYKVDAQYGPKNEVKGYRPMGTTAPAAPSAPATAPAWQAQPVPPAQPAAPSAAPPWAARG